VIPIVRDFRRPASVIVAIALAAAGASPALSAPAQKKAAEPRGDMTGVWFGWQGHTPPEYKSTPYPIPPPLTPEGVAKSKYYAEAKHNLGAHCVPAAGPAGMMNPRSFFPMEIIQKKNQVTIILELMQAVRRIYLDGRPHDKDLDASWMGDSIGHWEGDTLVVDTVNTHEGVLNGAGAAVVKQATDAEWRMPYSEQLHLTERLRLIDGGKVLRDDLVITDPKYYTEPMKFTRYWRRAPEIRMLEYVCAENMRPADEGTPPDEE
jgi:hypothetical protein